MNKEEPESSLRLPSAEKLSAEKMSPENLSAEKASNLDRLNHYLALTFSLPERTARAMSAIVGGSTLLLSKTLLPNSIKQSNSYHFTVGMFQSFLIRNVAGIDDSAANADLGDKFVQRKLLGTSLEAAGLLTMHLSPVWVFAIASDAAKGGQVFLQRLVGHLRENGVIAPDSDPTSIEQILQSIAVMSQKGATLIDTPPLSLAEIRALSQELRESTTNLSQDYGKLMPDFEAIWNQIAHIAKKENISVEQVLGILSISAASVTRSGVGTADAVGKTGAVILDEMILQDYKETLASISDKGALVYLKTHMQPFMENAQSHFDFSRETGSQRWFKRLFLNLTGRLKVNK